MLLQADRFPLYLYANRGRTCWISSWDSTGDDRFGDTANIIKSAQKNVPDGWSIEERVAAAETWRNLSSDTFEFFIGFITKSIPS